jgi:hypothetical protein
MQWVPGALSPEVNEQGHITDDSPPSSGKVMNGGAITSLPQILYGMALN